MITIRGCSAVPGVIGGVADRRSRRRPRQDGRWRRANRARDDEGSRRPESRREVPDAARRIAAPRLRDTSRRGRHSAATRTAAGRPGQHEGPTAVTSPAPAVPTPRPSSVAARTTVPAVRLGAVKQFGGASRKRSRRPLRRRRDRRRRHRPRDRDGEFFSMLGPSGSGKTTTLRMIAGFELPTEGRILLHGEDVTGVPPFERDVNTVFQDYALFPHMTVGRERGLRADGPQGPASQSAPTGREALRMVRLEGYEKPQARPALGRPAAAGRPGPRARQPAARAAPRRAARRPRPQAPRGDADRAQGDPAGRSASPSSTSPTTRRRRSR